jgi:hypothetical protein
VALRDRLYGLDRDVLPSSLLELDDTVDEREQGIVTASAYVLTSMIGASTLTHEDVSCANDLTTKLLHSETLATAISSVSGTSYCFLMSH